MLAEACVERRRVDSTTSRPPLVEETLGGRLGAKLDWRCEVNLDARSQLGHAWLNWMRECRLNVVYNYRTNSIYEMRIFVARLQFLLSPAAAASASTSDFSQATRPAGMFASR